MLTRKRIGSSEIEANGGNDSLGQWRILIVDEENAVIADEQSHVAATSLDVADTARHRVDIDDDIVKILGNTAADRQECGRQQE